MIQLPQDWIAHIDMMQQEMNRLLDYFAGSKPPLVRFSPVVWEPAIDVYETDSELVVTVELAGVKEAEIEILIAHDAFTIRGERRKPLPGGERGAFYRMEIADGPFEKTVALPAAVDATNAQASCEDGLVEVVLPKTKERRARKVRIKTILP